VVYVVSESTPQTIQTYDIDVQTGYPIQEGQPLTLPTINTLTIVPSANGHFLYTLGTDSAGSDQLWVFSTDATGTPQSPAVQHLTFNLGTYNFMIDPNGTLAYASQSTRNSQGELLAAIRSFAVDPTTGKLSDSKIAATYPPNGPCSSTASAGFNLVGFNTSGNKLRDFWGCNYPDSVSVTYYARNVNQQNGGLGPDVQTFTWSNGSLGFDLVNFTPNLLIDFNVPNEINQGINSVNVYPLSGGSTPIFSCTAAMLEACGYGSYVNVDPSGKFIFIRTSQTNTQITKLEYAAKKIVDTGNYIPDQIVTFSPDGTVVYAQELDPSILPIYFFNSATGAVSTTGSAINVTPLYFFIVPAVRN
jgi:hypothetical protein